MPRREKEEQERHFGSPLSTEMTSNSEVANCFRVRLETDPCTHVSEGHFSAVDVFTVFRRSWNLEWGRGPPPPPPPPSRLTTREMLKTEE